jgi:hypothetical protein
MIKQVREERMTEISITELGESWCTAAVAKQLLGLDFEDSHLAGMTKTWCVRYLGIDPFHQREGLWIDRHAAETFLLQESLTSWRNAAIYLGMSEDDLHKTVDRLAARDMYNMIEVSKNEQLVHKREAELLFQHFLGLRSRAFSDHSKMCERLHAAIREEFEIEITPIYCATSLALKEESPEFAIRFDSLNGTPVGNRYQLWLNTKKPVNLIPDVCSLTTYVRMSPPPALMRGDEPKKALVERLKKALVASPKVDA